jgi:hypothetical protein
MVGVVAQVDAGNRSGVQLALILLVEREGVTAECTQLPEIRDLPIPLLKGWNTAKRFWGGPVNEKKRMKYRGDPEMRFEVRVEQEGASFVHDDAVEAFGDSVFLWGVGGGFFMYDASWSEGFLANARIFTAMICAKELRRNAILVLEVLQEMLYSFGRLRLVLEEGDPRVASAVVAERDEVLLGRIGGYGSAGRTLKRNRAA